jgi:hypothetical protein
LCAGIGTIALSKHIDAWIEHELVETFNFLSIQWKLLCTASLSEKGKLNEVFIGRATRMTLNLDTWLYREYQAFYIVVTGGSPAMFFISSHVSARHEHDWRFHWWRKDSNVVENNDLTMIAKRLNTDICSLFIVRHQFSAIVYNPSSRSTVVWLRVPVGEQQTIALDEEAVNNNGIDAYNIAVQLNWLLTSTYWSPVVFFKVLPLPSIVQAIPIIFRRNQPHELLVRVNMPALSLQAIPFLVTRKTWQCSFEIQSNVDEIIEQIDYTDYFIEYDKLNI